MIVVYLHWERWASGRISVEFCNCHWSLVFLALECPSLTGFFLQAACILSQALNFHTYRSHRALLGTRKCQYFRKQLRIDLGQFWWIQLFQKDKKKIDFIPTDFTRDQVWLPCVVRSLRTMNSCSPGLGCIFYNFTLCNGSLLDIFLVKMWVSCASSSCEQFPTSLTGRVPLCLVKKRDHRGILY